MASSLCKTCRDLLHELLSSGSDEPLQKRTVIRTASRIEASAHDCCAVCATAMANIESSYPANRRESLISTWFPPTASRLGYRLEDANIWFHLVFEPVGSEYIPSPDSSTTSASTFSSESMEKLLAWLRRCDEHKTCMSWAEFNGVPQTMPTRLLELDYSAEPPRARLVASNQLSGHVRYVTLSHCWGGQVPLQLLRSNMSSMNQHIDFQKLPKTFQDCIRATQVVGIQHLWIDCLCIIQDAEEDWQREASLMEQVYPNCYLNIAATDSENSTQGLFRDRNPREAGCSYIPVTDKKGFICYCYCEATVSGPLDRRAWVVQERFLSPRTVHYIRNQLVWECSESFTLEGLPAGINLQQDFTTLFKQHNTAIVTAALSPEKIYKVYELWDKLVFRYTLGHLSFSSDRPVAIAGIARVICRHLDLAPSDYQSGLWRPRFVEGICWKTNTLNPIKRQALDNFGQNGLSRIPTWSWLSVNGPVWQDHRGQRGNYTTPSELIEIKTKSLGDLFGPVVSSQARVRGPLCQASITPRSETNNPENDDKIAWWNITLNTATWGSPGHCRVFFDSCRGQDLVDVLRNPIYLLAVRIMDGAGERDAHGVYWCVILIPIESQRACFRRIGFVDFGDTRPWPEPEEAITNALNRTLAECFIRNDIPEHMYEMVDDSYLYTINLV
ncbi:hypothetical protein PG988_014292 [Apiospora saccharicola]